MILSPEQIADVAQPPTGTLRRFGPRGTQGGNVAMADVLYDGAAGRRLL